MREKSSFSSFENFAKNVLTFFIGSTCFVFVKFAYFFLVQVAKNGFESCFTELAIKMGVCLFHVIICITNVILPFLFGDIIPLVLHFQDAITAFVR